MRRAKNEDIARRRYLWLVSLPIPKSYKVDEDNLPDDLPIVYRWVTNLERSRRSRGQM